MGRKPIKHARQAFPEPLQSDFLDFCEAHRGAPGNRIIQDAVRAFIDDRLRVEPELKKRFDEARASRLGLSGQDEKVTILRPMGK